MLNSRKLGCILIQLPPRFGISKIDLLEGFFKMLPADYSFAIEFRDVTWMDERVWGLLSEHSVAYTIVDEPLLPPSAKITSDFAYFRWHGKGSKPWYDYRYSKEELEPWVPKLRNVAGSVKKVFGYFNNHFHGYAVENCLQVLEMLGSLTSQQTNAKKRVETYLNEKSNEKRVSQHLFSNTDRSLNDTLLSLMGWERLRRAEQISDEEVSVQVPTGDRLQASVRDYHITIDSARKVILHDCLDWNKCIVDRMLCKHIGKLLLSLNRDTALDIARRMKSDLDLWIFSTYEAASNK
jgi:hypothetical protein